MPRAVHSARAMSSGRSFTVRPSAAQNRPRGRAAVLPIAHPLSVAPAVRAEEGDFFAGEQRFKLGKERLEHTFFQHLGAHCRTAQRQFIVLHRICGTNAVCRKERGVLAGAVQPGPERACAIASVLPVPDQ